MPAVAFFVARAREVQPGFSLSSANAAAVTEICRRLDGLPLALELAASRLTVLPMDTLLTRLDRRLQVLTRGPRDLPERQQTLRAAISWSYDLLPPGEQRLFRQLGVFVGGVTLEDLELLMADEASQLDPLDGISSLVGKSLVVVRPLRESTPRYSMFDTIREFAVEQLEAHGELQRRRRRHAKWVRDVCERSEPLLLGPGQREYWRRRVEQGYENVRAALSWSLSPEGDLRVGVAIAGALGWRWLMTGQFEEAQAWTDALLARRPSGDESLGWAKLLHASAHAAWGRGDLGRAAAREERALAIFRTAGDPRWLVYGLATLARVRTGQQRPVEAHQLLEEARSAWRDVEPNYGQPFDAYLLYYLGLADLAQEDVTNARAEFDASLAGVKAAGDHLAQAVVLGALGLLAARTGDHTEAQHRFAEAVPVMPLDEDPWDQALLLLNAGLEDARAGLDSGRPLLVQALRAWRDLQNAAGIALALAGLGVLAAAVGDGRRAGQLLGVSQALLPAADPLLAEITPFDVADCIAHVRARVDVTTFDRGVAEGATWSQDQAINEGLAQAE